MAGFHGAPPRGLDATRSQSFEGRFGRIFRNLPPASFGATEQLNSDNLKLLAQKMTAGPDPAHDGKDGEESGIPALYTYFGQFVDHDITFDPVSPLTKFNDPDGLVDFRTPSFDLDNVYGRGPNDQPYIYDGNKFLTGSALTGSSFNATDLPRFNGRALIGDPRNDENSIVSQLQGLFHRFHNRLVDDNPSLSFEKIQQLARFHYQYVVLHDFLPRIVSGHVLNELKTGGKYDQGKLKFYHWRNYPFMPVEFSVAAYRLGHSMIRPGYRLNDADKNLLPIFPTQDQPIGLTGFQTMAPDRAIDWGRFIDIDKRNYSGSSAIDKRRLQFAYRIDTSLVDPLSRLPEAVVKATDPPPSLVERNLLRGWRLKLPSGQDVARAMGVVPLRDAEILIGKAVDPADVDPNDPPVQNIVDAAGAIFADNCPLWAYILAEAAHHRIKVDIPVVETDLKVTTPQLGPVGGRIVAEVFLGMMFGDDSSLLSVDPNWQPVTGSDFKLKSIVNYSLGQGPALRFR
jgi:hypothetical protein